MIPIGTDVRLRRPPVGNWVLVGINVAIFLLVNVLHSSFVETMLPPLHASVPTLYEYISYQFRHGDFWHLAGNMLFLWVFGNAVCDRMGSFNYVVFYLAGGVFAGVVFTATNSNPLVGASGAIAAVTTAFLVLYPRVHVTILILFVIITTIQLPAMFFIVFKIILWDNMIAPSIDSQSMASSVAFSAHLGGYAFGFFVAIATLVFRGLPRNQFDLLALWSRWQRRAGLPSPATFSSAPEARPLSAPAADFGADENVSLSPAQRLQEDILDRLSEHDVEEAARLYGTLLQESSDHILPRSAQLEIGNYLAQSGQHGAAIDAYERFLAAYPTAADAPQVRLYAGLICRRYLHDPVRAAGLLQAACDTLALQSQRDLAAQELRAAEADVSGHGPEASET